MELPGSDLAWMALQVETLFVHDARGRLARPNDAAGVDAVPPRFFLGRTRHGNLWRFGDDLAEVRVAELARLAAGERADRPLDAPPERLAPLRALLERDAPVVRVFDGPAFHFPPPDALPEPETGPGAPIALTEERADLVRAHFPELVASLGGRQPCFGLVEGRDAVAVCYAATGPGPAVEAGVETAPGFRRRGLATRVVASWARATWEHERLPLYSTRWSNAASRGVARRLGLTPFGVDLHLR